MQAGMQFELFFSCFDSEDEIVFVDHTSRAYEVTTDFEQIAASLDLLIEKLALGSKWIVSFLYNRALFIANSINELLQIFDVTLEFCRFNFVHSLPFLLDLLQGNVLGECGEVVEAYLECYD